MASLGCWLRWRVVVIEDLFGCWLRWLQEREVRCDEVAVALDDETAKPIIGWWLLLSDRVAGRICMSIALTNCFAFVLRFEFEFQRPDEN